LLSLCKPKLPLPYCSPLAATENISTKWSWFAAKQDLNSRNTLKTAIIAKLEGSCNDDAIIPHDRVSFAYRTIEVEYKEQKADRTLGGAIVAMDDWLK
jgi:hypothetical protein